MMGKRWEMKAFLRYSQIARRGLTLSLESWVKKAIPLVPSTLRSVVFHCPDLSCVCLFRIQMQCRMCLSIGASGRQGCMGHWGRLGDSRQKRPNWCLSEKWLRRPDAEGWEDLQGLWPTPSGNCCQPNDQKSRGVCRPRGGRGLLLWCGEQGSYILLYSLQIS